MTYADLTDEQRALANYMRDISNWLWCAQWLIGLEFSLWGFVTEGPGQYGNGRVTVEEIAELKRLSTACGGWIVWRDEDDSETFVPLPEWLEMYRKGER